MSRADGMAFPIRARLRRQRSRSCFQARGVRLASEAGSLSCSPAETRLGEDGHTASLFTGGAWGTGPGAPDTLAVLDAPKPPPQRVSLSAARLSRARQVVFLVAGESKRRALSEWRAGNEIPARAIMPAAGIDVLVESALLAPPEKGASPCNWA
jgi:glucosamine-6-phosphate isomerase/6-phosphogluconolactonase